MHREVKEFAQGHTAKGQAELIDICSHPRAGARSLLWIGEGPGEILRRDVPYLDCLALGLQFDGEVLGDRYAEEISQVSLVTALGLGVDRLQEKPFS